MRRRKALNKIASRIMGTNCGRKMKRPRGKMGGARLRALVVTMTEAVPLPVGKEAGFIEQVVFVAVRGREQDKFTWAEKPF